MIYNRMKKHLFAGMLAASMALAGTMGTGIASAEEENVFVMEEEFQEIVLADNETCCFKITGVEEDDTWGYTWKVYAENKTDKNVMFAFDNVAVNGYMCDPFWASEVGAGMKTNSEVSWYTDVFEENGITDVENVVFTLRVSDYDDWMAEPYLEEIYTVAAAGKMNENAKDDASQDVNEQVQVIADNEECYFSIKNIREDDIWGYTWDVYLENRTDKTVMFALEEVCVNGFVCDPFWASEISPGMKANESLSWMSDDFENNNITEVTEVEFLLSVSDSEDWMADAIYKESAVVYPLGEDAAEAAVYERIPVENETVILDHELCKMIVTGFDEDHMMGYGMKVYLENKTDKAIVFSLEDTALNGFMCDPFWASTIPAGKRSNEVVVWYEDSLKENAITLVDAIEGVLTVRDEETYDEIVSTEMQVTPW